MQAPSEGKEQFGVLMRAILHEPHFQALEAAWRSLDFLVRNIERDDLIKIYIFDIPKQKLEADLLQSSEFRASDTYRVLVEESVRTPGAEPWALIVGNYGFDRNSSQDVDLLAQMGLLARAAQAPFLAEAIPSPGGDQAGPESWHALRLSSHASWLGLVLPRLLLRLPYGEDTSRIESFSFEEMPGVPEHAPQHNEYLWGNPAFGCAYLMALSFSELGWDFRPGLHREIAGLPLHVYKSKDLIRVQACAELLLTDSDCEELLEQGLMPVASVKDRASVRLIRFQSIAKPAAALSGRWI
jgi:type VI secretion system protein ImpC